MLVTGVMGLSVPKAWRMPPHDAAALHAQIALGAARIERDVAGLARGDHVELAQAVDVLGQEVLQMLECVMAVLGQAVQVGGLLEDIQRGMNRTVADDVDTHSVAALRSRQNQLTHALGRNCQTALVAREARIGIGLGEICRVFARHAVEELLKARCREQRVVRVAGLEFFQARLVIQQCGKQMGADAQLAGGLQLVVNIVANKVAARHGHERHIAD